MGVAGLTAAGLAESRPILNNVDWRDMADSRNSEKWHVGKEVPLALIFAIAMQTAGGIWFAATYVAKIDTLTTLMAEFKATQYSKNDAQRDFALAETRTQDLTRRVDVIETRLSIGVQK